MNYLIKNLVSLIVIVGIVLAGYWYMARKPEEMAHIDISYGMASSSNPADQFAELLAQLSSVNFQGNDPVFNDPVFKNGLVSFRRDLPIIDRSRSNPFAPLEANLAPYVRYLAPAPASLVAATSSFPTANASGTTATGTKKK